MPSMFTVCVARQMPISLVLVATTAQEMSLNVIYLLPLNPTNCMCTSYSCRSYISDCHALVRREAPGSSVSIGNHESSQVTFLQFMHIPDRDRCNWLRERIETQEEVSSLSCSSAAACCEAWRMLMMKARRLTDPTHAFTAVQVSARQAASHPGSPGMERDV